jgi:hypothetical protein
MTRWWGNQPEPDFEDDFFLEDDGLGNIRHDLISGEMPAVRISDGGNLQYVSLVREAEDRKKPELIRVLIVHPATSSDKPLECSIKISLLPPLSKLGKTKLDQRDNHETEFYRSLGIEYKYTALSYSWEGQMPSETIYIRNSGPRGHLTLNVTKNLKAALVQLRDVSEPRIFWADAVCMNQDDKAEKSQQLPLMPRIYGEADTVCVWLGNKDPDKYPDVDTAKAFGLIKKIRKWEDYNTVVEKKTTCDEWDAFIAMMNQNWFRRRWIVQEIVLAGADHAELWWGKEHIPWIEFAQAVALFEGGLRNRVKAMYHASGKYEHHPDMFGEIQEFNASRLVKVTAEIVSRRDDGRVVRKRETLESLISRLKPFDTGQAHDIVYAVLSLAKDVSAGPPSVNLNAELQPDELPLDLRRGCNIHYPRQASSKFLLLSSLGLTLTAIGSIVWICTRDLHLWSRRNLSQIILYLGLRGIGYWLSGVVLVVLTVKVAEWLLKSFYLWIVETYHRLADFVVSLLFGWRTRKDVGEEAGLNQIVKCDCLRKVQVLNNVMRRLKLEKFPVDYDKSFGAVCDDLYTFATLQSMSLDLICRPWCPTPPRVIELPNGYKKWLPTWVRTLEDRPFKPDSNGHIQRVNADTLVGTPGTSPYQASGAFRSGWKFERDGETQILSARGFQLDIINDNPAEAAESGILPKKWLKNYRRPLGGEFSDPESKNPVSTQFWRTMIAGKGPNGQNPPLSYSLVCQELFGSEDGINLISVRDRSTNDVLKEFITRVLSVIWGRKLARTSKLDRLALLPFETEKGHVICILNGCSVPVVLKKTGEKMLVGKDKKGENIWDDIWELIGECYVYEMMAGEALAEKRKRINDEPDFYKDRVFKIR